MAKPEWGAKHTCMSCGGKFYDLHRNPITCPKCGTEAEVETARPNRRRPSAQPAPAQPANDEAVIAVAADETDDDPVEDIDDAEPAHPEP